MTVRVRFAPSPTGLLHLGNARTALFNWLYARHHGGTFVLRVEDTDQERYSDEYLASIEESLHWLGINWDEGPDVGGPHAPYNQMGRLDRYRAAADALLAENKLYRCFCTPEEIQAMREQAQAEKRKPMYDGRCAHLAPEDAAARAAAGDEFVLRARVPSAGAITFDDVIRGPITIEWKEIDDFICVRSNGTPVYQFTVAVDDADMDMTHVIRGEDHISNTPKQLLLLEMLGHSAPVYAHLPLINGEDGKKLSKRHGAQTVTELRDMGYIREAVINYFALLGWSAKTEEEIFSLEELVQRFDLDGCGKAAAVFSLKKLDWFNGQWIRKWSVEQFCDAITQELIAAELCDAGWAETHRPWLLHLATVTQERVNKLPEIVDYATYYFRDPDGYDEKGVRKHFAAEGADDRLRLIEGLLTETEPFDVPTLEAAYKAKAESAGLKLAALIHPTRLATTGTTVGAPLFDTLVLLGRERCLARVKTASDFVSTIGH